jgi:cytochrome c oxidase assembly protein subunit 11
VAAPLPVRPLRIFPQVVPMLIVVGLMFGLGFAMAPFYDAICEYFGVAGKLRVAATAESSYPVDLTREVSFEFVTSVNERMPLEFRVETPKLKIHPGQYYTVRFYAVNRSNRKIIGQAIPSVAPAQEAGHLKKTQCFCFTEQEFEPNQEREMPVRFVVDPGLSADVKDMTLSYTFFDITDKKHN